MKTSRILSRIIPGTALMIMLMACRPTGVNPTNCREGTCTYTFETGKEISITIDSVAQYVEIVNGDHHVLNYQYVKNDRPNIADDEYTENIFFELDPIEDNFSFGTTDLSRINLVMTRACFCPLRIAFPQSGIITGSRDDDGTWNIEFDVTFSWDGNTVDRSFSASFEEEE